MKMMRFLPLAMVLAAGCLLVLGMESKNASVASPLEGQPVPEFALPSLQHEQSTITQASLTGEVQLLNVWASWCGICKSEHEYLKQLVSQQAIAIVGLNYRDDRQAALGVLKQSGNPYRQVIYDPQGALALDLGVYGTPETYLIDKNGVIRHRYVGALTPTIWQQQFAPRIEQLTSLTL